MTKECIVILLSTNDLSYIHVTDGVLRFYDRLTPKCSRSISQHLYICSNEKIKEGDNVYTFDSIFGNEIESHKIFVYDDRINYEIAFGKAPKLFKIIASTESLQYFTGEMLYNKPVHERISFIPQSFINEYIEQYNKGNKIEKVVVEYIQMFSPDGNIWKTTKNKYDEQLITKEQLKLNGNEIIINKIEEKLYTLSELKILLSNYGKECWKRGLAHKTLIPNIDTWIKNIYS